MDNVSIQRFFNVTSNLIDHTKQVKKLKGENFNLFEILRVETAENNTHSNFISELLNPKGSHGLGSVLLRHFLDIIDYTNDSNFDYAEVYTEYYIGKINSNLGTGGRIDVFIRFPEGTSICIENKIWATDQNQQILRYCNYNVPFNKVYYLNLDGSLPDQQSYGDKKEGEDFHILRYDDHIIRWLDICLKESFENPVLRESIKQYKILIKKLTNTLDNKEQQQLERLILDNYEEAKFIAANYPKVLNNIKNRFRDAIFTKLQEGLNKDKFIIVKGSSVDKGYSQIWINLIEFPKSSIKLGIESFSGEGHLSGNLFVGILDSNGNKSELEIEEEENLSAWWRAIRVLKDSMQNKINLSNREFLEKVKDPQSEVFNNEIKLVTNQILDFVNSHEQKVFDYIKSQSY